MRTTGSREPRIELSKLKRPVMRVSDGHGDLPYRTSGGLGTEFTSGVNYKPTETSSGHRTASEKALT